MFVRGSHLGPRAWNIRVLASFDTRQRKGSLRNRARVPMCLLLVQRTPRASQDQVQDSVPFPTWHIGTNVDA
eukprot:3198101-Pyramimonas_sp.AAC.1